MMQELAEQYRVGKRILWSTLYKHQSRVIFLILFGTKFINKILTIYTLSKLTVRAILEDIFELKYIAVLQTSLGKRCKRKWRRNTNVTSSWYFKQSHQKLNNVSPSLQSQSSVSPASTEFQIQVPDHRLYSSLGCQTICFNPLFSCTCLLNKRAFWDTVS